MSLRRPTVACLLFIYLIRPLCGVAQTPDCGMFIILLYKPFMWRRSDARLRHALYYYPFKVSLQTPDRCIFNFLLTCIMSFILGLTKWSRIILVHDYHLLCYTCFHDVCEYIQKYSLACPWLFSWPDFLHGEERCDDSPGTHAKGDSSLAKIGVILVSYSCGKWSPIDADETQTASAINH